MTSQTRRLIKRVSVKVLFQLSKSLNVICFKGKVYPVGFGDRSVVLILFKYRYQTIKLLCGEYFSLNA